MHKIFISLRSRKNQMLHSLSRRGTGFAFFIGLALSALVFYFCWSFWISPAVAANDKKSADVESLREEVEKAQAVEASEAEFNDEFKRVVLKVKEVEPHLPRRTELAEILGNIQIAAENNGVVLKGLSATKDSVKQMDGKLYEREMPAIAIGEMSQIIRFFYSIANLPRIFVIKDFSVVSVKDKVSVQFNLSAFNSPSPAEMPALPPELQKLLAEESNSYVNSSR